MAGKSTGSRPQQGREHPYFDMRRGRRAPRLDVRGYWSYPLFMAEKEGTLHIMYLICGVAQQPKKKLTAIFRPKAALLARPGSSAIVSYTSFRFAHDPFPKQGWDKPIALFPHNAVAAMKVGEFKAAEHRLLALVEPASKEFQAKRTLPQEYRDLWLRLTHPILLPYVRKLAPGFFRALGVERSR